MYTNFWLLNMVAKSVEKNNKNVPPSSRIKSYLIHLLIQSVKQSLNVNWAF